MKTQKTRMSRENRLIFNLLMVCLITFLLIRDRAINKLFEIVITQPNESSIVIPGYLVSCEEKDSLHCEMNIDNLLLIVKSQSSRECQVTYGKQTVICQRIQASAADIVSIEDLQLSPKQKAEIKWRIMIKPIASLRILDDGIKNGVLLQGFLGILSIWSGINAFEALYFYFGRFYPHPDSLITVIVPMIVGFVVMLSLALYFLILLAVFGYIG